MSEKLKALNTIGIWIIVLVAVGYLFLKPSNTISKDTVTQLTTVVDKLSIASDNMTKLANAQREWFDDLKNRATTGELDRNRNYGNMYEKYGYDDNPDANLSLDSFYGSRVQQQTNDLGRGHVRQVENGDSKAGSVQKPDSQPQRQSH